MLYDEDPLESKGKEYVGSVVWRTEQVKAVGGQKPDLAVRADIDIPARRLKMTIAFRRNTGLIIDGVVDPTTREAIKQERRHYLTNAATHGFFAATHGFFRGGRV